MKNILNTLTISATAILALTSIAGAIPQEKGMACCGPTAAKENQKEGDKPFVAKVVKGVQTATITIDGGKYVPSAISVEKGKPVELTFKLGKSPGCGGTVVFKSLKFSEKVMKGKTVVVKFTPKEAGNVSFTCGMGMYDGKVIVK